MGLRCDAHACISVDWFQSKSVERLIELKNMVELLLLSWQAENKRLSDTFVYYCDFAAVEIILMFFMFS